jgi:hypothetical protein
MQVWPQFRARLTKLPQLKNIGCLSHRFHLESVREVQHRIRLPLGLFNKTPELDGHRYGTYIRGDVMWRCDRLNGEELSMLVINNVEFKVRACI